MHVGAGEELLLLLVGVEYRVLSEAHVAGHLLGELVEVGGRANLLVRRLGVGAAVDDAERSCRWVVVLVGSDFGRERLVLLDSILGRLLRVGVASGVDPRFAVDLDNVVVEFLGLEESRDQRLDNPSFSSKVD